MMGPPGSGKGTQGKLLADKLGAELYSTGKRCREFAASGTYFGNRTKEMIEKGDLMPEWFSIYLFEDKAVRLEPEDKVVFDGSGRKVLEANRFHEVMAWLNRPYKVLYIHVPDESLHERLLGRASREGRPDDEAAAIKMRFERFREHTVPSIEFFRSQGMLVEVSGEDTIENVHQAILKALQIS
jgi:adenylate kinase